MTKNDILATVEKSKKVLLNNLSYDQSSQLIVEFLQSFEDNYSKILDEVEKINVRFSDYYSPETLSSVLLDYFCSFLPNNIQISLFSMYVIYKKLHEIIEAFEVLENEEVYDYIGPIINDLNYLITELKKFNKSDKEDEFDFENGKYKIFFTGYSYEDVIGHENFVAKALINKLNKVLSVEDNIKGVEIIEHVKDKYNVPLFRMHLADDYRITFLDIKTLP